MSSKTLDGFGQAGVMVALTGGLLAFVPQLEHLLSFDGGWGQPLVLMLVAGAILTGALLTLSGSTLTGAITAAAAGFLFAVLGPTAPGMIGLLGGALLYVGAHPDHRSPSEHVDRASERTPERPRRQPTVRT